MVRNRLPTAYVTDSPFVSICFLMPPPPKPRSVWILVVIALVAALVVAALQALLI